MQQKPETLKQQWDRVEELLESWLQERKELLVLYCNHGKDGQRALDGEPHPRWTDAKRLCQILVDYVSAGHFEIYDQLLREAEFANDDSVALAAELYPKIHETTQASLDFNDKYSTEEHWELYHSDFQSDLSSLGEALSHRFEIEDRLINEMHNSHEALLV